MVITAEQISQIIEALEIIGTVLCWFLIIYILGWIFAD